LIRSGVRPESVGTLTPAQLQIILLRSADAGQTIQLTPCEAEDLRAQRVRQRDRWIEEQLDDLRRGNEQGSLRRPHRGLDALASIADTMTNDREPDAQPAERPPDNHAEGDMLRSSMRELLRRIDELLAERVRPIPSHPSAIAPRFSDGP